jgi:hypothetical protein
MSVGLWDELPLQGRGQGIMCCFLWFASVLYHFHMVSMEMCFDVLFVSMSLDMLGGEMV